MEYPMPEQNSVQTHPYQRIGGFLWLFLVSMVLGYILIIPLITMAFKAVEISGEVLPIVFTITSTMVVVALETVYVVQLLCRKPAFFTMFHIAAILKCVQNPLQSLIMGQEPVRIASRLIASILALVLYYLYFTHSVRVRTYMGTDAYITQCPFSRRVKPPQPAVPDSNT